MEQKQTDVQIISVLDVVVAVVLSTHRSRRPAARTSVYETRPSENGAIGPKES